MDSKKREPKPKRSKKKRIITAVGIVGVIAVLAVGFLVWHAQPSFCNAICHVPMDPFLPTYEATPGECAIDKWGNDVEDASGMLAAVHRLAGETASERITCMSCHVPTLSEQIGEGISWISGKYTVNENPTYGLVLPEKKLQQLVEARGIPEDEFCLRAGCHDVTRDDLVQATSQYDRNPHATIHSILQCSDCHKAHRASTNYCEQCHQDAPLPNGWLSYSEASALKKK